MTADSQHVRYFILFSTSTYVFLLYHR